MKKILFTRSNKCHFQYDYNRNIWVLHNENGPAVIHDTGSKEWWLNGKPHNMSGPAYISTFGYIKWYYDGKFIGSANSGFSQEEFERLIKLEMYW